MAQAHLEVRRHRTEMPSTSLIVTKSRMITTVRDRRVGVGRDEVSDGPGVVGGHQVARREQL
ncbi:hypothetical protein PSU4_04980 [Pseudonocardia sulfidoxydans NBRC 16205]|uniref:Uncharacterized protein n=1 Tax=Pseudonocardia sulfidoxydans NBRC 16205 TaxID=1223511 RepID=A0A511DCZ1_9PSEU|nr:hypothetical protein PSU4_04980 [Pseudonocardia sulfidoxydans NBRC 16205]